MIRHSLSVYLQEPWQLVGHNWEAPCTLIVEGVHHGSHGPIYWASHILRAAAPAWEGVSLTMGHPEVNGQPVSINHSPEVRAKYEVGRVVRPFYDEAKKGIRATLQVRQGHPKMAEIMKLKEVSVGIFSDQTQTYGRWNGEEYSACAISMQPDHLAALPEGQRGACSWQDSCGIRTNQYMEGYQMTEVLLPTNIVCHEGKMSVQELRAVQAEADRLEILLPTGLNINLDRIKNRGKGQEEEVLLPTGFGGE